MRFKSVKATSHIASMTSFNLVSSRISNPLAGVTCGSDKPLVNYIDRAATHLSQLDVVLVQFLLHNLF